MTNYPSYCPIGARVQSLIGGNPRTLKKKRLPQESNLRLKLIEMYDEKKKEKERNFGAALNFQDVNDLAFHRFILSPTGLVRLRFSRDRIWRRDGKVRVTATRNF